MAQWLKIFVLKEDLGLIFNTTIFTYSYRESSTFWPLKAPDMHVMHNYTCRQDFNTYKI